MPKFGTLRTYYIQHVKKDNRKDNLFFALKDVIIIYFIYFTEMGTYNQQKSCDLKIEIKLEITNTLK